MLVKLKDYLCKCTYYTTITVLSNEDEEDVLDKAYSQEDCDEIEIVRCERQYDENEMDYLA